MTSLYLLPYAPELQPSFEAINKAWVNQFFTLEPFDIAQLEHPEENILGKGGEIIFAAFGTEIIGTVALVPSQEEGIWEMIKMGVSPSFQGKGAGTLLGTKILEIAKAKGAKKVQLFSHTKLEAALHLYAKLGFSQCASSCSGYGRCNVKMEIEL